VSPLFLNAQYSQKKGLKKGPIDVRTACVSRKLWVLSCVVLCKSSAEPRSMHVSNDVRFVEVTLHLLRLCQWFHVLGDSATPSFVAVEGLGAVTNHVVVAGADARLQMPAEAANVKRAFARELLRDIVRGNPKLHGRVPQTHGEVHILGDVSSLVFF